MKPLDLKMVAHWDGRYWRIGTRDSRGNVGKVAAQEKYRSYSECITAIQHIEEIVEGICSKH